MSDVTSYTGQAAAYSCCHPEGGEMTQERIEEGRLAQVREWIDRLRRAGEAWMAAEIMYDALLAEREYATTLEGERDELAGMLADLADEEVGAGATPEDCIAEAQRRIASRATYHTKGEK